MLESIGWAVRLLKRHFVHRSAVVKVDLFNATPKIHHVYFELVDALGLHVVPLKHDGRS